MWKHIAHIGKRPLPIMWKKTPRNISVLLNVAKNLYYEYDILQQIIVQVDSLVSQYQSGL